MRRRGKFGAMVLCVVGGSITFQLENEGRTVDVFVGKKTRKKTRLLKQRGPEGKPSKRRGMELNGART